MKDERQQAGQPKAGRRMLADKSDRLSGIGLEKYASVFAEAEIDFLTLTNLVEDNFKELGLPLGPRREVWGAVKRLGDRAGLPPSQPHTGPTTARRSTVQSDA